MRYSFLEGRNVVWDALRANRVIVEILLDRGALGKKIDNIKREARKRGIPIAIERRKVLDKLSKTKNHQGVIAKANEVKKYTLKSLYGRSLGNCYILIKEVSYDQNLGAILRTSLGANVSGVIVSGSRKSLINSQVERVSMGASNYVPVVNEGFYSTIKFFKKLGFKIIGIESIGNKSYFESDLTGNVLLIFGGEDKALGSALKKECDEILKIPMDFRLSSLNLSVSVGIILYEKLRQEVS